ncbi:hypothetical protein ACH5RR_038046 [Cinchona calisaya]|uniref:Uncharacterized protein n=1 Tax=Cinchona calisaya TaxID=153742 RepID=A0ABD2YCL7_9GENT
MFLSYAFGLTARVAFGKKSKYQEEVILHIEEATKMTSGFNIADVNPSGKLIQVISENSLSSRRCREILMKYLKTYLMTISRKFNRQNLRVEKQRNIWLMSF